MFRVKNYYLPDICHELDIHLSFKGIITGPAGSGKTNLMVNMARWPCWDKVVILSPSLHEPLYKQLISILKVKERLLKRKIVLAIDSVADLPTIESFNPQENNLLIVDGHEEHQRLTEFWLRGRLWGITCIATSHSYCDAPKIIRKNSDYIFVKHLGNPRDFERIAAEYSFGVTADEIKEKYDQVRPSCMTKFFMIDHFNLDPAYRFRNGFKAMDI